MTGMWEAVELRHLRAFLAVADELHFGRAAERLRISQSRVSQLVRTLETIVGEPLFARSSRRVALTAAGERLRARARPAYLELRRAVEEVSDASHDVRGELRVGLLLATSGGRRLGEIIRLFERRHPASRVTVTELDWNEPLGPLRRGDVDITAIRFPIRQPDITVGPVLTTDPRVLAVAEGHPLAGRRSVSVEDLAEETLAYIGTVPAEIVEDFLPRSTPSGRPIARRSVSNPLEMLMLVAQGELVHATVASLPEFLSYPGVTYVPIVDLPPSHAGLIWRSEHEALAIRAFAKAARDVVGEVPEPSVQPGFSL
jgi:DNA-binding transcriptional LysR family regulator